MLFIPIFPSMSPWDWALPNFGSIVPRARGGRKTFKMNQRKERALSRRRLQRRRDRH